MFTQIRFHVGTERDDAQLFGGSGGKGRLDQHLAELMAAQRGRYFGMNQDKRLRRTLVRQKRRLAVDGDFELFVLTVVAHLRIAHELIVALSGHDAMGAGAGRGVARRGDRAAAAYFAGVRLNFSMRYRI